MVACGYGISCISIIMIYCAVYRYLTHSVSSLVSYRVKHPKINSIFACAHVLFSIHHIPNCGATQGFLSLRKAVATHVKKYIITSFFTCVDIASQLLTRHSPFALLGLVDE